MSHCCIVLLCIQGMLSGEIGISISAIDSVSDLLNIARKYPEHLLNGTCGEIVYSTTHFCLKLHFMSSSSQIIH